jgi:DNA-binding NarL/FixJ family response regulator
MIRPAALHHGADGESYSRPPIRPHAQGSGGTRPAARILIVEDHPLVSHGLAELIADEERLEVCGRAASAAEAALLFETTRPDLVILDVLLPDRDGFDLMVDLLEHDRSAKIVVFSSGNPEVYARRAREGGAVAFVSKGMVLDEIVPAIRAALEEKSD